MDHDQAEGMIFEYADGELSVAEAARVGAHVAACARCSQALEGWRRASGRLSAGAGWRAPQGFEGRVMAALERRATDRLQGRSFSWRGVFNVPRWEIAAALAGFAAVALYSVAPNPGAREEVSLEAVLLASAGDAGLGLLFKEGGIAREDMEKMLFENGDPQAEAIAYE